MRFTRAGKTFLSPQIAAWDEVLCFLRQLVVSCMEPWERPNRRWRLAVGEEGLWITGILDLTDLLQNLYALFDLGSCLSLWLVPTSLCPFWHRLHCLKSSHWRLTAVLSSGTRIVIASSWYIPGLWNFLPPPKVRHSLWNCPPDICRRWMPPLYPTWGSKASLMGFPFGGWWWYLRVLIYSDANENVSSGSASTP